jgi:hypothetical protein
MKKVIASIVALFILLFPSDAGAGTFYRYGLGVFHSENTKAFSIGYEEDVFGPIVRQVEVGGFFDQSGGGRSSSGFANYSLGVEVNPGYFLARSMWGVGAITNADSLLGGWFEFSQDLLLGVRDDRGRAIGVDYKHISSAGIYCPNVGRDFITVHVEIPW